MKKEVELTFDLQEKPNIEELEMDKLTEEALKKAILKEFRTNSKFISENEYNQVMYGKYGIPSRLRAYNFDLQSDDPIRKYDILRLEKYLFKLRNSSDYKLFHLLDRPSYMSSHPFNDYYEHNQSKFLDGIEKEIEEGIKYQLSSASTIDFTEKIQWQKNCFYREVNDLVNAMKRVYFFGDGHCFTDDYISSIKEYCIKTTDELRSKIFQNQYSVFEEFYQILVMKRSVGPADTQVSISTLLLDILKSELTPVSQETIDLFGKSQEFSMDADAGTIIIKNVKKLAPIIFDNTGITADAGIRILKKPSNLKKINLAYNMIYGETRYAQNSKRQPISLQYIISLCRAMFAIKEYQNKNEDTVTCKLLYQRIFNSYGYFLKNDEKERSISFGKDIKRFDKSEEDIREYAVRLLLEITNACYLMYFGKKDFAIKRFETELEFDKFISNTLNLLDYKYLDTFFNEYYEKLRKLVLPNDFILYIMEHTLREHVTIDDNFTDFMRQLILAGCHVANQNPMYYIDCFFKRYHRELFLKPQGNFSFIFEFDSYSFEINVTKFDNFSI